jgi:hypothetical protein
VNRHSGPALERSQPFARPPNGPKTGAIRDANRHYLVDDYVGLRFEDGPSRGGASVRQCHARAHAARKR